MKEVMIQGVAMIPASEVYAELERLTASRTFWRQAAAQNGREAAAYKAQLDLYLEAAARGVVSDYTGEMTATEVSVEIKRLKAHRDHYLLESAEKQAQLEAIREALYGEPDCDLVALAKATYTGCEIFELLAGGDGVLTRQMIVQMIKGGSND